jgi:hypothetical protein
MKKIVFSFLLLILMLPVNSFFAPLFGNLGQNRESYPDPPPVIEANYWPEVNRARPAPPQNEPKEPITVPEHKENPPPPAAEPPQPAEAPRDKPEAAAPKPAPEETADTYLNDYVLSIIDTYEIGLYPYLLNNDYQNYNGVTTTLYYQDRILARAHPSGNRASHCVGLTFEVFVRAMRERNRALGISPDDFNGMTFDDLFDFMLTWYVANGPKTISNIAVAVEKYGIGRRIASLEDARPGDFLNYSRENGTGHTVVFIEWLRENNRIIGLKYWSTQGSTNGINYNKSYFNVTKPDSTAKYGNVIIDQVDIARVSPVRDYKSFR